MAQSSEIVKRKSLHMIIGLVAAVIAVVLMLVWTQFDASRRLSATQIEAVEHVMTAIKTNNNPVNGAMKIGQGDFSDFGKLARAYDKNAKWFNNTTDQFKMNGKTVDGHFRLTISNAKQCATFDLTSDYFTILSYKMDDKACGGTVVEVQN